MKKKLFHEFHEILRLFAEQFRRRENWCGKPRQGGFPDWPSLTGR
ncbi:hypothetical protein CLOSTASPAR_06250 [[Clostridium] asparagiforme DSM 15981]|uniref:Uncharacterized protein n=1 Tax=[Clostridium] asparagiforme DSM 15981 TaxID=518636 RepID=C0DAE7_9FIRM|nr:hypothetical protein CLOSTASPAR_06250 [[Clostridium] asparagiforme DSM 15981]